MEFLPFIRVQRFIAWRQLFLLVALLVPAGVARADSKLGDFAVTRWTRENGLPDNSVTCLMQTLDGFLWIGTDKGLARFDGVKFVPLRLSASGAGRAEEITALYQDADERLWIGTREDGLWCLTEGLVKRVNPIRGLESSAVTCIAGDSVGGLWVGTTNGLIPLRWNQCGFFYRDSRVAERCGFERACFRHECRLDHYP